MGVQPVGSGNGQTQAPDIQPHLEQVNTKVSYQPIESAEGAKAISEEAFAKQIENLNKLLSSKSTNVSLSYDSLSSPEKVAIVDTESGKVIKEIPAQAAVEIATKAKDYILGLMIDKKA